MNLHIPVILIVEDILSEFVLRKMLASFPQKFIVQVALGKEGFGFIQKNMRAFNRAADTITFLVLTDLDQHLCPRLILESWLPDRLHPNMMFRVAIREVEAWLLAHRQGIANYFDISIDLIPQNSEAPPDPKAVIIDLARHSPSQEIRDAIIPGVGRRRKVGPDYNGCLLQFVHSFWEIDLARLHSQSLHRALLALERFQFQVPATDILTGGRAGT